MKLQKMLKKAGFVLFIVLFVFIMLFPFYWQLLTSLKSMSQISELSLLPDFATASLNNYVTIFAKNNFGTYLFNSFGIASITTLISVTVASMASYALARLRFRGKTAVLGLMLSCSMFPAISILSPVYMFVNGMGLRNSWPGLILPYLAFAMPLSVWYLTAFFRTIPFQLEEAAKIDGCTPLQALVRVIIPLAIPGTFTTAILIFIQAWNEYLFAFTINAEEKSRTVPVGIVSLRGEFDMPWVTNAAAIICATIPIAILVLILQRRIISGLTSGAVKG